MSAPGLIMLVRERWPEQAIHLSVQANAVNYAAVENRQPDIKEGDETPAFLLQEEGRLGEYMPAYEDEHGTYIEVDPIFWTAPLGVIFHDISPTPGQDYGLLVRDIT